MLEIILENTFFKDIFASSWSNLDWSLSSLWLSFCDTASLFNLRFNVATADWINSHIHAEATISWQFAGRSKTWRKKKTWHLTLSSSHISHVIYFPIYSSEHLLTQIGQKKKKKGWLLRFCEGKNIESLDMILGEVLLSWLPAPLPLGHTHSMSNPIHRKIIYLDWTKDKTGCSAISCCWNLNSSFCKARCAGMTNPTGCA